MFARLLYAPRLVLLLAVVWFFGTRLPFVWGRSFPIGDGGLWMDIVLQSGFDLSRAIIFNHQPFPLVYPPLGGFVVSALSYVIESVPLILLFLPLILSLLSLLAFYLFARSYFSDVRVASLAVLLFPMTFQSLGVFILGGGVSRGLGLCFLLLAWWSLCRPRRSAVLHVAGLSACTSLAILSHPNAALWTVAGIVFLSLLEKRISIRFLLVCGGLTALLTVPWWGTMLSWHGIYPFIAALQTGGQEMFDWRMLGSAERFLLPGQALLGGLGLIGICLFVRDRLALFPALLLMGLAFDHRGLFVLHGVVLGTAAAARGIVGIYDLLTKPQGAGQLAGVVFSLLIGSTLLFGTISHLTSERKSLNTPTGQEIESFKILSKAGGEKLFFLRSFKGTADSSEWFATLSGKEITPLPQGQEWNGKYGEAVNALLAVKRCCDQGSWTCVQEVASRYAISFDAIAVHKPSCSGLLSSSEAPRLLLDTPSVALLSSLRD